MGGAWWIWVGNGALWQLEDLPRNLLVLYFIISLNLNWIKMVSQRQEPEDGPVSRRQHHTHMGQSSNTAHGAGPVEMLPDQCVPLPICKTLLWLHRLQTQDCRSGGQGGFCWAHGGDTPSQRG